MADLETVFRTCEELILPGHKTRGWLLFTMSVQIALLIFNIILVSPALAGVLPEGGPFEWAVIFTSAAQGAGQMVMVGLPFPSFRSVTPRPYLIPPLKQLKR